MDAHDHGSITICCHGELNDLLSRSRRHQRVPLSINGHETIKDVVESFGVPHPEVEALFACGAPVNFAYRVASGDHIDAYGTSSAPPAVPLRPPLGTKRFVLDTHLGRLAAYLRMLGFDTLYRNDYDDPELATIANAEQRVLLTRDVGLLKRSIVTYGYFLRATDPEQQLREVAHRYRLHDAVDPFQRCMRCNGLTTPVDKTNILDQIEPKTRLYYNTFRQCQGCGQVYWPGSHFARMQRLIADVLADTIATPNDG